jgi:hypothetical protein
VCEPSAIAATSRSLSGNRLPERRSSISFITRASRPPKRVLRATLNALNISSRSRGEWKRPKVWPSSWAAVGLRAVSMEQYTTRAPVISPFVSVTDV